MRQSSGFMRTIVELVERRKAVGHICSGCVVCWRCLDRIRSIQGRRSSWFCRGGGVLLGCRESGVQQCLRVMLLRTVPQKAA
jgi:hypothetical protein